jgi:hypothetical protein
MTFSEEQVEWIVVEVIRRLGLLQGQPLSAQERSSSAVELVVTEKVVTLRLLEGRLSNVAKLLVAPRAVVTPAVKDELRARNIELVVPQG